MPWDVLVNRLDRYLRIGYVSAVLAGLVLAAEVTVLSLSGSPEDRRDQLADAATSVAHWKPNAILIVLAVVGALTAAYFVGVASRSLTFAIMVALMNAVNLTRSSAARWWRGHPRPGPDEGWVVPSIHQMLDDVRRDVRAWWRRTRGLSEGRRRRQREWTFVVKAVGRSLLQPFLPPIVRTTDLWLTLDYTYGAEAVNRTLERHPIKVRVSADVWQAKPDERERARQQAESQLSSAAEYCQLWLQRYASEVAIPSRANRFLMLGTAALPAILLPRSLREIGGDLDAISSLMGLLRWGLWAGALLLFLGVLREGPGYAVAAFQRFVVVEMAEAARRDTGARRLDAPPKDSHGDH
jgi:hypothetical protein